MSIGQEVDFHDLIDGWTESEKRLYRSFLLGEELDLGGVPPSAHGSDGERAWKPSEIIRSEVLASLLLHGPGQATGHPRRLLLSGAKIAGKLDLGCGEVAAFSFRNCHFTDAPFLNDATADFVGFQHCSMPGLSASRLICNGPVWLSTSIVTGSVNLETARIAGDLTLMGTKISARQQVAISARQMEVQGSLLANDFRCDGSVDLVGVKISGSLQLNGSMLKSPKSYCLNIDHGRIGLGFLGMDSTFEGVLRAHHAWIGCQFNLARSSILNKGKTAFSADHLSVDGALLLNGGFFADGGVDLHGAQLSCTLNLYSAHIRLHGGVALKANEIKVGNDINAIKSHIEGRVRFTSADVSGVLALNEANITASGSMALDFSRSHIAGGVIGSKDLVVAGGVSFADAVVDSQIDISEASVAHPKRKALDMSGLNLQGDAILNRADVDGMVDMVAANISGDVRFADAKLRGVPAEKASRGVQLDGRRSGEWRGLSIRCVGATIGGELDLRDAEIGQTLTLAASVVRRGAYLGGSLLSSENDVSFDARDLQANLLDIRFRQTPAGGVLLDSADVETLVDGRTSWSRTNPNSIEGMTYTFLDTELPVKERLAIMALGGKGPSGQPFEQLAKCLMASGQDDSASLTRWEYARISHNSGGPLMKAWGWIQNVVIGYGYAPARALAFFLAFWVSAALWFRFGTGHCANPGMTELAVCAIKVDEHPTWDPWIYALDLLIPIIDLGHDKAWDPVGADKVVAAGLTVSGWVLTTTIAAAGARALRKS
ncbi:hypothetical protein KZ829_08125 [Actinoplanes hulinensis]|uniref:Membrane-associated oxidoreductase n=1 Tax=Actinoplanes hulinensis TaxID=1144547 RepID=A0ABS7AY72_9ACTN|nr:hypothetical protein [Actinoplanes hulinensis]MBW6433709.1 hypothetical protein [Actinoplanes hulinensis]